MNNLDFQNEVDIRRIADKYEDLTGERVTRINLFCYLRLKLGGKVFEYQLEEPFVLSIKKISNLDMKVEELIELTVKELEYNEENWIRMVNNVSTYVGIDKVITSKNKKVKIRDFINHLPFYYGVDDSIALDLIKEVQDRLGTI